MVTRRAYTLMEMMLVLAIMVIVASMTLPALRGPMENQRLRKSGDLIRAEWAKARVRAMKSGRIHVFRYQAGGANYGVEPYYAADDDQQSTNDSGSVAGGVSPLHDAQQLPDRIVFSGGDSTSDSRSLHVEQGMGGGRQLSRPILFYPDGTSSTARVLLMNSRQTYLLVSLRGLTGIAQVSDLLAANELPQ